jgi:hypothetical protein
MSAEDRRLTELVQDAAEAVDPADRLVEIRARVGDEASTGRSRVWWAVGGGALVAAATVTVLALGGALGGVDRATTPSPAAPGPATNSPPTAPPSSTEPRDPGAVAVAVYYVGDTPVGPRLYREFQATAADDTITDAAQRATAGTPLDPDYRSAWGRDAVASVTYAPQQDAFVVRLVPSLATSPPDIDPEAGELALQSLVYTVQGAAGRMAPLTFWYDDARVDSVLGVDTTRPIGRAPGLDVLSLVNVTTPEQGSVVTGPEMTISGVASSFEATVPWEVLDADGERVLSGFAMAEGWDRVLPWEGSVDVSGLPPGDYTFVARTDDPSAGEGPGPFEDTKDITIE